MSDKNPFFGATFAERLAARQPEFFKNVKVKAIDDDDDDETVEDKAVSPSKASNKSRRSHKSS